jgi:hypothetical protein
VTVRDADLSDYRCFYEAGRLVRLGLDPYDAGAWQTATMADPLRLPPCPRTTFAYPLWTAMLVAPLTFVPIQTSIAIWEGLLFGCVLFSVVLLARAHALADGRLLLALTLWSQPMFSAIANAQLGPVVLLGSAGASYALQRAKPRAAAAAWWLLLVKPNMVLAVLVGLPALARSARFASFAIAGAAAIFFASLLIVPTWPFDLLSVIGGQQLLVDRDLSTLWSLADVLGLPPLAGLVAAVAIAAVIAALIPWRALAPAGLVAALVALSFVITPYTRAHDELVLATCWAATLGVASRGHARPLLVTGAIVVALLLPWALTLLSLAGLPLAWYVLVPLATASLAAYALRIDASARPLG